jgi:protein TonB
MFDVFEYKTRQTRSAAPVIISIAGHVVLVVTVIIVPLLYATDNLPKVPNMMAFVAAMPAAPPPPPPPPPPPAPKAQAGAAERTAGRCVRCPPSRHRQKSAPNRRTCRSRRATAALKAELSEACRAVSWGGLVVAPPPPPPPPPPPAPRQAVRIGGNIQAPTLIKRVEPTYPDIALVAKVTGLVILEASVGKDGTVESVRILRSVKFLDEAAVQAVKQWRYQPLVLNGVATPFVLR